MKFYFLIYINKTIKLLLLIFTLTILEPNFLNAQETYFEEMQIDSSTKFEENSSALPTNPFEILDKIRRYNSMNDATNPSEAIDDALKSFSMIEDKEKL